MIELFSLFSGIGSLDILSVVVTKLVPALLKIVGAQLQKFAQSLENFFKELGVIEENDKLEEIGDQSLQAEQDDLHPVKIEDFDSHEKYLAAVKEYEVDAEKSALIPADDKLHKAIEILFGMAIERYGQPMSDFGQIVVENPEFYAKSGRLEEFAAVLRSDPKAFAEILSYIENKNLSTEKNDAAFEKLVEMEKKHSPDAADADIWTAVSGMRK